MTDVHVHTLWKGRREGLEPLASHALYSAAKGQRDFDAAAELLDDIVSERVYYALFDAVEDFGLRPVLIAPAAQPADSNNALAISYARWLGREFDWPVETRVFHRKSFSRDLKGAWPRIAHPCAFYGEIDTGAAYVIVDDVMTLGGTIADLRSFILRKGGRVIAASAIASPSGDNERIKLGDDTLKRIRGLYRDDIGKVDAILGYRHVCLTEAEGRRIGGCYGYVDLRKKILGARNSRNA
ncbi:MAG: hypothetical protein NTV73_10530 [Hyphomicrobiales bacterium]|nr:hypothetical protein [Hyphomicrobiales bacterium]